MAVGTSLWRGKSGMPPLRQLLGRTAQLSGDATPPLTWDRKRTQGRWEPGKRDYRTAGTQKGNETRPGSPPQGACGAAALNPSLSARGAVIVTFKPVLWALSGLSYGCVLTHPDDAYRLRRGSKKYHNDFLGSGYFHQGLYDDI